MWHLKAHTFTYQRQLWGMKSNISSVYAPVNIQEMDLPGDDSISWRVLRDKTPLVGGFWNLRLKNKPIIKPHTKKEKCKFKQLE